jgi:hypothetical protein
VDETYRMLGREHEADLAREAEKRRLAAGAQDSRPARARGAEQQPLARRRVRFLPARLAALLR